MYKRLKLFQHANASVYHNKDVSLNISRLLSLTTTTTSNPTAVHSSSGAIAATTSSLENSKISITQNIETNIVTNNITENNEEVDIQPEWLAMERRLLIRKLRPKG